VKIEVDALVEALDQAALVEVEAAAGWPHSRHFQHDHTVEATNQARLSPAYSAWSF